MIQSDRLDGATDIGVGIRVSKSPPASLLQPHGTENNETSRPMGASSTNTSGSALRFRTHNLGPTTLRRATRIVGDLSSLIGIPTLAGNGKPINAKPPESQIPDDSPGAERVPHLSPGSQNTADRASSCFSRSLGLTREEQLMRIRISIVDPIVHSCDSLTVPAGGGIQVFQILHQGMCTMEEDMPMDSFVAECHRSASENILRAMVIWGI